MILSKLLQEQPFLLLGLFNAGFILLYFVVYCRNKTMFNLGKLNRDVKHYGQLM